MRSLSTESGFWWTPLPDPPPPPPVCYSSIDKQLADIAALDAWTDAVLEREYIYHVTRTN